MITVSGRWFYRCNTAAVYPPKLSAAYEPLHGPAHARRRQVVIYVAHAKHKLYGLPAAGPAPANNDMRNGHDLLASGYLGSPARIATTLRDSVDITWK